MLRKIYVMLLCATVTLISFPQQIAANGGSGDFTYTLEGEYAVITGYTGSEKALTVPSEVNGYPVKAIGENAFEESLGERNGIRSVVISEGITEIRKSAFYFCSQLVSVTLPESLQIVGYSAFALCLALESIRIPDKVTQLEALAFHLCRALTTVEIGRALTSIGYECFGGNSSLQSFSVDKNNTVYASGDSGLLFSRDYKTLVLYPKGRRAAKFTIPDYVTTVNERAFSASEYLEEVYIPDSVTKLGNAIFYECSKLNKVKLSSQITKIGLSTFFFCSSLTVIEVPAAITSIEARAFSDNAALQYLVVHSSNTQINVTAFESTPNVTIVCPDGSAAQTFAANQGLPRLRLPSSIEITSPPTKTMYLAGHDLDLTGMVVTGIYGDLTSEAIPRYYQTSAFDPLRLGEQTITVSCGSSMDTFSVMLPSLFPPP